MNADNLSLMPLNSNLSLILFLMNFLLFNAILLQNLKYSYKIGVREIFEDNNNWEKYKIANLGRLDDYKIKTVERMLECQDPAKGYLKYKCEKCGEEKYIKFSCNSRICSRCGKRYVDEWSNKIMHKLLPIPHRHFVFTIPAELWFLFELDNQLCKLLLDNVIITFKKVVGYKRDAKTLKFGIICTLHTYGSDLKFNPHVHAIVSEGGIDKNGNWVKCFYFKYDSMRKVWQYQVLKGIRDKYKNDIQIQKLINNMFQKYKNGFVIDGKRRISNMKKIAKYVVRYVRHPSIADSRIQNYDRKIVQFKYKRRENGEIHYYERIMEVNEFIEALLNLIPPKNFKLVRYYGIYGRRSKDGLKTLLDQLVKCYGDISIYKYGDIKRKGNRIRKKIECPNCKSEMKLVEIYYNREYG